MEKMHNVQQDLSKIKKGAKQPLFFYLNFITSASK